MFPIRDTIRSRSVPVVNWLLILANVLVFFHELSLSPFQFNQFILNFALVPARLNLSNPLTWGPLFTHMFLHNGWFHILSNVWVLFIFGDNVEDRIGSLRYLVFYLVGGIVAGLVQVFFSSDPTIPALGASGAIAAVLGAYFFYFPKARVTTLILIFILPWFIDLPAVIFIGFWFVSQLFSGLLSLSTANGAAVGGVAWWAHIGGFLFGLLLAAPFALGRKVADWHPDQYWPW
jgi:membrane associated rhomboid family serine protease